MCPADAAPGEEVAKSGKGEKPVEELVADAGSLVDEGEKSKCELEGNSRKWTTFAVNVREDLRSHALGCKSLEGTGRAEGARVGDGQDGNGDDRVEDRGETLHASVLESHDERRGLGVRTGRTEQELRVGRHEKTNHEQVHD